MPQGFTAAICRRPARGRPPLAADDDDDDDVPIIPSYGRQGTGSKGRDCRPLLDGGAPSHALRINLLSRSATHPPTKWTAVYFADPPGTGMPTGQTMIEDIANRP